jgi:diadenosine tetraphosphatase ApaH/serine/threonine PP2A family protein phosphatase
LLHRLFVQRHGWFVHGLENSGEAWNASSPTGILKQHAEEGVHDIFEKRLSNAGFSLHQVAVFAATLEHMVHTDSLERLRAAYRVLGLSDTDASLTEKQVGEVMKSYMMMYVLGLEHSNVSTADFQEASENILEIYPTWPDTELFANEVRQSVLADVTGTDRTTQTSTLKVLEEVGERYGRWQDGECRALKKQLVEMDERGTGRVTLERFYGSALTNASWNFLESVPYLRQLVALEETNPERMSVIIPNYVNSPSNCVASSKFYSVCCIDECEALLGTLEDRIAAPEATPALIAQMVAGLPSDTMQAPRDLSSSLVQRLEEIAVHHGGRVPLHGRLFAQWMHHAYPRECPYPHVSGTTKPMTAEHYIEQVGGEVEATHDEIREIMEKSKAAVIPTVVDVELDQTLPWSAEEELFVHRPKVVDGDSESGSLGLMKTVMPLLGVVSMALVLTKLYKDGAGVSSGCGDKLYV